MVRPALRRVCVPQRRSGRGLLGAEGNGGRAAVPESQDLPAFPYADYARMLGLHGIRVDDPDRLGAAWDEALSGDRPTVIEVMTDPSVPLLAPFPAGAAKLDQMRKGIAAEGKAGERARTLLDLYAAHEGGAV